MSDNESIESDPARGPGTNFPVYPRQPRYSQFYALEYSAKVICALLFAYYEVILPAGEDLKNPGDDIEEVIQFMRFGLIAVFFLTGVSLSGIRYHSTLSKDTSPNSDPEGHHKRVCISCKVNLFVSCCILVLGARKATSNLVFKYFFYSLPLVGVWHVTHLLSNEYLPSYVRRRYGRANLF